MVAHTTLLEISCTCSLNCLKTNIFNAENVIIKITQSTLNKGNIFIFVLQHFIFLYMYI